MDDGSIVLHGVGCVQHRGENLVVYVDEGERLFGQVRAGGGHRRHCVPLVQGLFAGQHVPAVEPVVHHRPLFLVDHLGGDFRQVGGGDDGFHPRQSQRPGRVDTPDAGMGVGATQNLAVQHPGQVDIGGVTGPAHHLVGSVMPDRTGAHHTEFLG